MDADDRMAAQPSNLAGKAIDGQAEPDLTSSLGAIVKQLQSCGDPLGWAGTLLRNLPTCAIRCC